MAHAPLDRTHGCHPRLLLWVSLGKATGTAAVPHPSTAAMKAAGPAKKVAIGHCAVLDHASPVEQYQTR